VIWAIAGARQRSTGSAGAHAQLWALCTTCWRSLPARQVPLAAARSAMIFGKRGHLSTHSSPPSCTLDPETRLEFPVPVSQCFLHCFGSRLLFQDSNHVHQVVRGQPQLVHPAR
jgi:hypothetical protein